MPIEPNSRILDLGCGTGSLTQAALGRFEGGEALGIDVAAPYVEHARSTIADPRASFLVADGSALPFPSATFDAALSLLVLNFIPDHRTAAAEMLRVTRSGGTIAAACWDLDGGFVMTRMFWDTAAMLDPHASELRGRALSAPLTRAGELAELLRGVGAIGVEEADLTIWMRFVDFGDFWSTFSNGQGNQGGYVARLEQRQREELQSALFDAYCAGRPDGPRSFAATAHAAKGTKQ